MNSSQIVKRTIPVLIIILLVVGAAVLASVLNKDKIVPSITDKDGAYLTVTEGDRTYSVSKKYMYDELKSNVGNRVLMDTVDKYLLENKVKGESNYYASVTTEEIDEAINDAVFPTGKEGLTEEEINEKLDEYYRSMHISAGLKTQEEIRDYHRLILARKAYASDMLVEEIDRVNKQAEENDTLEPFFTESQYETKYKAKYLPAYWAIIIPFKSQTEAKLALEQVGLKVDEDSKEGNYANLVKIGDEETVLSPTAIAQAFIEMYNTFYSNLLEDYPTNTKTLLQDVQYRFDGDNLVFNNTINEENEAMNKLYFTNEEVAEINKQVENFLKGMLSYSATTTENKWYTAEPRVYDSKLYVYMLKIKVELVPELAAVKDEIYKTLFEEELSDIYIAKKMIELRELNNFEILDEELEKQYSEFVEGYELDFKTTKAEDEKIVARVTGLNITADDLFNTMDKHYGFSLVASEVNYLRFLNSVDLNKIYDYYTPDITSGKRVLDKEKWEEVRTATINEKNIFLSGGYTSFPPTYGWKNFLRDYYGVNSVEDLMYTMLYTKLRTEYSSSLLSVEDLTLESAEWVEVQKHMEKIEEEYFTVNGLQILISVKDEEGAYVPQEEWSDLQTQYAEELYGSIWDYIGAEAGDYDTKLNTLVAKFNDAPRFLASRAQDASAQPVLEGNPYVFEEGDDYKIELSKYKTAGLNIEYLKINTLSDSTTVSDTTPEELKAAAKEVYNSLPAGSSSEVRYGYTYGSNVYEYLTSKTGYHVYINTSTVEPASWTDADDVKHVLPTLQMIKTVAIDNASNKLYDLEGNITDVDFTTAMKTSVTKYFDPIKSEITGSTNLSILLYSQMQDLSIDFKANNFTKEEFNLFLDEVIEIYEENLIYINVEE